MTNRKIADASKSNMALINVTASLWRRNLSVLSMTYPENERGWNFVESDDLQ